MGGEGWWCCATCDYDVCDACCGGGEGDGGEAGGGVGVGVGGGGGSGGGGGDPLVGVSTVIV